MSDFVFETLKLNTAFIRFIQTLFSSNPEFLDYAIYRCFYLIPLFIAFIRNRANLRLIFLGNLALSFIGISVLDFISKTQEIFVYTLSSFFYLLPFIIASCRNSCNLRAIFFCNLVFGFTGISWLVILIWSVVATENKPSKKEDGRLCPHCKELIRPDSKVCHHCHRDI